MAIKKIALITASTRPARAGPAVTSFIHDILKTSSLYPDVSVDTIDTQTFHLPLYDHPSAPAMFPPSIPSPFPSTHPAIAWSQTIASYDAYIVVTPEYNGGLPAGFKNALDYLYYEFKGKPAFVISYGVHGGNFANEELRRALGVIMGGKVVETKVELVFEREEWGLASGEGKVGEKTMGKWKESAGEVVKGFQELGEMLMDGGLKEDIAA